jgi:hypothetical protein
MKALYIKKLRFLGGQDGPPGRMLKERLRVGRARLRGLAALSTNVSRSSSNERQAIHLPRFQP